MAHAQETSSRPAKPKPPPSKARAKALGINPNLVTLVRAKRRNGVLPTTGRRRTRGLTRSHQNEVRHQGFRKQLATSMSDMQQLGVAQGRAMIAIPFGFLPAGIEEQYFRRLPEGWLLAGPRPLWLMGPRPTYLVSDAQKPAIAQRLRRNRYLRLLWALLVAAIVLITMRAAPGLLNRDSIPLFVLLIFFAVNAVETLSIRPLLAGLPQTNLRMPVSEMLKGQTRGMSVRTIAILALFFLLMALFHGYLYFTTVWQRELTLAATWFAVLMAVIWFGMLVAKLRRGAGRTAGEAGQD